MSRLTLHAERLTFADRSETPITIEAPLPKDFRALLNALRKYGK